MPKSAVLAPTKPTIPHRQHAHVPLGPGALDPRPPASDLLAVMCQCHEMRELPTAHQECESVVQLAPDMECGEGMKKARQVTHLC